MYRKYFSVQCYCMRENTRKCFCFTLRFEFHGSARVQHSTSKEKTFTRASLFTVIILSSFIACTTAASSTTSTFVLTVVIMIQRAFELSHAQKETRAKKNSMRCHTEEKTLLPCMNRNDLSVDIALLIIFSVLLVAYSIRKQHTRFKSLFFVFLRV